MSNKPKFVLPGYTGPRKTTLESIRLFCIQCMGGSFTLITVCPSSSCLFFPYRTGTIEAGASRRLLRVIKQHCEACLPGGDVSVCTAGKYYLDLPPCPCWPYRRGVSPYFSAEARAQRRERALLLFGNATQEAVSAARIAGSGPKHSSGHPVGWCGAL
jgi:hypothetical protein